MIKADSARNNVIDEAAIQLNIEKINNIAMLIDEKWGIGASDKMLSFITGITEKLALQWYAVELH